MNKNPDHIVYIVQSGPQGPVKIGVTTDLQRRLKEIQTGAHSYLKLIAYMPVYGSIHAYAMEKAVHETCSENRMAGEWFGFLAVQKVHDNFHKFKWVSVHGSEPDITTKPVISPIEKRADALIGSRKITFAYPNSKRNSVCIDSLLLIHGLNVKKQSKRDYIKTVSWSREFYTPHNVYVDIQQNIVCEWESKTCFMDATFIGNKRCLISLFDTQSHVEGKRIKLWQLQSVLTMISKLNRREQKNETKRKLQKYATELLARHGYVDIEAMHSNEIAARQRLAQ